MHSIFRLNVFFGKLKHKLYPTQRRVDIIVVKTSRQLSGVRPSIHCMFSPVRATATLS